MRILKFFTILFLFCFSSKAQELHREMISSQGASIQLESGIYVTQTIGQQSLTGNIFGERKIIQGFQQPYWTSLISSSELPELITINYYPNPVIKNLNFDYTNYNDGVVNVMIFDFAGRIIINQSLNINSGKSIMDLSNLPSGTYLIYLRNNKINYYTKIIKK